MRLTILGSSSAANGYVLDNGREALALECGCPLIDLQRAVDFDLRRVAGVLLTHEHGDHARHALKYIKSALPLYASEGTLMKLPEEVLASTFSHPVRPPKPFRVGGFRVLPFGVKHDAAEPLGFLVVHPEMGAAVFATDTRFLPYTFDGVKTWLLECNYDAALLAEYDAVRAATGGLGAVALHGRRVEGAVQVSPAEHARIAAAPPDAVIHAEENDVILVRMGE